MRGSNPDSPDSGSSSPNPPSHSTAMMRFEVLRGGKPGVRGSAAEDENKGGVTLPRVDQEDVGDAGLAGGASAPRNLGDFLFL